MKKLILLSLGFTLLCLDSIGQISFDTTYHKKVDVDLSIREYRFQVKLTNESTLAEDSVLNWKLTKVDMPPEWDYIIRPVEEDCGYTRPDTAGSYIHGASQEFNQYIYFYFWDNTPGSGTIHYAVSSELNPNYADTAIFEINVVDLASSSFPNLLEYSIYPNPASDYIKIRTEPGSSYQLMDIQGRIIKEGQLPNWINFVDVKNISSGSYVLRLQNKNSFRSVKILVE